MDMPYKGKNKKKTHTQKMRQNSLNKKSVKFFHQCRYHKHPHPTREFRQGIIYIYIYNIGGPNNPSTITEEAWDALRCSNTMYIILPRSTFPFPVRQNVQNVGMMTLPRCTKATGPHCSFSAHVWATFFLAVTRQTWFSAYLSKLGMRATAEN